MEEERDRRRVEHRGGIAVGALAVTVALCVVLTARSWWSGARGGPVDGTDAVAVFVAFTASMAAVGWWVRSIEIWWKLPRPERWWKRTDLPVWAVPLLQWPCAYHAGRRLLQKANRAATVVDGWGVAWLGSFWLGMKWSDSLLVLSPLLALVLGALLLGLVTSSMSSLRQEWSRRDLLAEPSVDP